MSAKQSKTVMIQSPSMIQKPAEKNSSVLHTSSAVHGYVTDFMKELAYVNERNEYYATKLQNEKQRSVKIDENIKLLKDRILGYQEIVSSRSGAPEKTDNAQNRRKIALLEKEIARTKIKLNIIRTDNLSMRDKITAQRQEKQMRLAVAADIIKEIDSLNEKNLDMKDEVARINDRKLRIRQQNNAMKSRVAQETERFTTEIELTKGSLFDTQDVILSTVRERTLNLSHSITQPLHSEWSHTETLYNELMAVSPRYQRSLSRSQSPPYNQLLPSHSPTSRHKLLSSNLQYSQSGLQGSPEPSLYTSAIDSSTSPTKQDLPNRESSTKSVIRKLLEESGARSLEEYVQDHSEADEITFQTYREIQKLHEELDRVEIENKEYQSKVEIYVKKLEAVENANMKSRKDVEERIDTIQTAIVKYEMKFGNHLEVLNNINDSMALLLKNMGREESIHDQKLLAAGLTDRTIAEYLAVLEERVDEIIQMSKAAAKQPLTKCDFVDVVIPEKIPGGYKIAGISNHGAISANLALPSITEDEQSVGSEKSGRSGLARPVNISALKSYMQKRISTKPLPLKSNNQSNLKQVGFDKT